MPRRANPYENAMAEKFFSILKSECIRLFKPETIREAQTLIDSYIAFYNHERHSALLQALSFPKTTPVCLILFYPINGGFISVFFFWNSSQSRGGIVRIILYVSMRVTPHKYGFPVVIVLLPVVRKQVS